MRFEGEIEGDGRGEDGKQRWNIEGEADGKRVRDEGEKMKVGEEVEEAMVKCLGWK